MLTTEIQQDTHTGPVTLNPRWLRIPSAVKYSGLSRSRLYQLLTEGRIKSICLKSHNDALRGVRLVDRSRLIYSWKAYRKSSHDSQLKRHEKCLRQAAPLVSLFSNFGAGFIPIFAMLLPRMIMGPSRPWSDRYLFSALNALQRPSTWEVLRDRATAAQG